MTPEQIRHLDASFQKVAAIKEQAAALFYARLFDRDPSLRPLFSGDLVNQGQKLMAAIPFFHNSLAGDLMWSTVLFGGFALAERGLPALRERGRASD